MPIRLEDSQELLERAGEEVVGGAKKMWEGFTDFALQDNVLEVAVGLMLVHIFSLCLLQRNPLPPLTIPGAKAISLKEASVTKSDLEPLC